MQLPKPFLLLWDNPYEVRNGIRPRFPKALTTTLPTGAEITFTPNPQMKGGDLIQFEVPLSARDPEAAEPAQEKAVVVYATDSFRVCAH
jgi:hypothetical protein